VRIARPTRIVLFMLNSFELESSAGPDYLREISFQTLETFKGPMELTELELEFLRRLADEPWTSPPLFDHSLVVRLVEARRQLTLRCLHAISAKDRGRERDRGR
jgi:hypothetical protein